MVAVNIVAIAALGWLLINGAPAALTAVVPVISVPMPVIELPEWAPKMPDVGGAVQGAVDTAMAPVHKAIDTTMQILSAVVMLAVGLVVLWLLFTFRGTLSGIGGEVWKAGSGLAGMIGKGRAK